jgi:electron transport complex protein RnfB
MLEACSSWRWAPSSSVPRSAMPRCASSVEGDPLVEKIDAILPQTQCGQCGFPAASPTPRPSPRAKPTSTSARQGGEEGIHKLADLLGREFKPLSAEHGIEKPKSVAVIDEQACIGCTLCIQACPVDAIVGAAKQMHTVVAAQCTGCELCIAALPGRLHRMAWIPGSGSIR